MFCAERTMIISSAQEVRHEGWGPIETGNREYNHVFSGGGGNQTNQKRNSDSINKELTLVCYSFKKGITEGA